MLSHISSILFSLLILMSFTFLFLLKKSKIFNNLNFRNTNTLNPYLSISSSYFIGICFFIFTWRFLDFFLLML